MSYHTAKVFLYLTASVSIPQTWSVCMKRICRVDSTLLSQVTLSLWQCYTVSMLLCITVTLYKCYIVTILHPAMQGLHLFCVWPPSVTLPSYQAPLQPSLLDFPNVDHVWAFFHNWPSNEILCSPSLVSKGLSMSKMSSPLGCFPLYASASETPRLSGCTFCCLVV